VLFGAVTFPAVRNTMTTMKRSEAWDKLDRSAWPAASSLAKATATSIEKAVVARC
jgi:uncharacterized membrane protein